MGLTCLNVDEYEHEDGNNGTTHFTCSICGAMLRSDPEDESVLNGVYLVYEGSWVSVSYCPNCGAKVVG